MRPRSGFDVDGRSVPLRTHSVDWCSSSRYRGLVCIINGVERCAGPIVSVRSHKIGVGYSESLVQFLRFT